MLLVVATHTKDISFTGDMHLDRYCVHVYFGDEDFDDRFVFVTLVTLFYVCLL